MHVSEVGSSAPYRHGRFSALQATMQLCDWPWVVVVQCWPSSTSLGQSIGGGGGVGGAGGVAGGGGGGVEGGDGMHGHMRWMFAAMGTESHPNAPAAGFRA